MLLPDTGVGKCKNSAHCMQFNNVVTRWRWHVEVFENKYWINSEVIWVMIYPHYNPEYCCAAVKACGENFECTRRGLSVLSWPLVWFMCGMSKIAWMLVGQEVWIAMGMPLLRSVAKCGCLLTPLCALEYVGLVLLNSIISYNLIGWHLVPFRRRIASLSALVALGFWAVLF